MKTYPVLNKAPGHDNVWRSGGMALRIPNLGTRWRWVVSFMTLPLYTQGGSPLYPLGRKLGLPQSWFGCCAKKNIPVPVGNRTPIFQPVDWTSPDHSVTPCYRTLFSGWELFKWLRNSPLLRNQEVLKKSHQWSISWNGSVRPNN